VPYPSTIATFTNKVDFRDVIFAEHVNTLQNEVRNTQLALGVGILSSIYSESPAVAWANTSTFTDLNARLNNIERGLINGVDLAPYFRKAGGALNDTATAVSFITKSATANDSVGVRWDQIQTKTSASANGFRVDYQAIPYYQTYRLLDTRDDLAVRAYVDSLFAGIININPLLLAGM
jgi:hypothetical protein